jgi:uncharacterized protein
LGDPVVTDEARKPTPLAARPARKCPICGKPASEKSYPFCSRRCANVDLNRWLSGSYAIPAAEEEPATDEDAGK